MQADWPPPIVTARQCPDQMAPPAALRALRTAQACGWVAFCSFAMGTVPDAQGRPAGVVRSVAVRATRGVETLIATWERPGDKSKPYGFRSAWHHNGDLKRLAARDITEVLGSLNRTGASR